MYSFDKLKPASESGIFFVNYFQPATCCAKFETSHHYYLKQKTTFIFYLNVAGQTHTFI